MKRFRILDLVWLTLVISLAIGWSLDHNRYQVDELRAKTAVMKLLNLLGGEEANKGALREAMAKWADAAERDEWLSLAAESRHRSAAWSAMSDEFRDGDIDLGDIMPPPMLARPQIVRPQTAAPPMAR